MAGANSCWFELVPVQVVVSLLLLLASRLSRDASPETNYCTVADQ